MRGSRHITISLFLLGIGLPALFYFFDQPEPKTRTKKQLPPLSLRTADEYLESFEARFAKSFPGRDFLLQFYGNTKFDLGISPLPHKLVVGKDGWLYLGNNFRNAVYAASGLDPLTPKKLAELDSVIHYRKEFCEELGVPYQLFVVPGKHSIYPEFLPAGMGGLQRTTRVDQLENLFEKNPEASTLFPSLSAAKPKNMLYTKYDTHWNVIGAWYGFRQLIRQLEEKTGPLQLKSLEEYQLKKENLRYGDLLKMVNADSAAPDLNYPLALNPENTLYFHPLRYAKRGDYLTTTNADAPNPQEIMILTDSYGIGVQTYFSDHFREVHFVTSFDLHPELVQELGPDAVVQIVVERHLEWLLIGD